MDADERGECKIKCVGGVSFDTDEEKEPHHA